LTEIFQFLLGCFDFYAYQD